MSELNNGIPSSFTTSVDRPFDPEGVRWSNDDDFRAGRNNERLNEEQIRELIKNPNIKRDNRMQKMTKETNQQNAKEAESVKIYNMSILDIATRTSDAVHGIMDEMLNYDSQDGMRGVLHIFARSDRLIYVGILIVIFTILVLLIKTTD